MHSSKVFRPHRAGLLGSATVPARHAPHRITSPAAFLPSGAHNPRPIVQTCASESEVSPDAVKYEHLLLTIIDQSPYLSGGSLQAVRATADLARIHSSKVTVLVVDSPGAPESAPRLDTISRSLVQSGLTNFEFVEKAVESKSSVLVGDVADEISADLVVLSSEAVHSKQVDANLLAEFVPCPLLLLP